MQGGSREQPGLGAPSPPWGEGGGAGTTRRRATIQHSQRCPGVLPPAWPTAPGAAAAAARSASLDLRLRPGRATGPNDACGACADGVALRCAPVPIAAKGTDREDTRATCTDNGTAPCAQLAGGVQAAARAARERQGLTRRLGRTAPRAQAGRVSASSGAGSACAAATSEAAKAEAGSTLLCVLSGWHGDQQA
jgi:hypothetical protein